MAQRNIIKIAVNQSAKQVIERIAEKHDMKEMGVASRIYDWFGRQDDVIQKAVLDMLPEGYELDVVRAVLERAAAEKSAKKTK